MLGIYFIIEGVNYIDEQVWQGETGVDLFLEIGLLDS